LLNGHEMLIEAHEGHLMALFCEQAPEDASQGACTHDEIVHGMEPFAAAAAKTLSGSAAGST
jgi:hypothetical protein